MKVVIAGNYRQYRQWLKDNGLSERDAIYADSEERLAGLELKESDIIYVGEYWKSPVRMQFLRSRIRKPSGEAE